MMFLLLPKKNAASLHYIKNYILFIYLEGILRVGGTMNYAEEKKEEAKHTAFLP